MHNKAVATYFKSGVTKTDEFKQAMATVCAKVSKYILKHSAFQVHRFYYFSKAPTKWENLSTMSMHSVPDDIIFSVNEQNKLSPKLKYHFYYKELPTKALKVADIWSVVDHY